LTQAIPPRPGATLIRPHSVSETKRAIATPHATRHTQYAAQAHHLFDYLHLVEALGAKPVPVPPRLVVPQSEIEQAKQLLPTETPTGGWFGLNPGAEYGPAKRWPAERFTEAAIEIHRHNGCGCLIFGGPSDAPLADEITHCIQRQCAAPILNLAGKTTLRQLCAVLKLCRVLLTNDTGPMHLAAALGTPVVVPFGSTSPELTGPGLPGNECHALLKAAVPCSPCFRRICPIDFRCMQSITVEQAVSAVLSLA
jgi:heptosyltransferase-2